MFKICLSFCLLLVCAFTAFAQSDAPVFESADCPFELPRGFDLHCGYVEVPESRGNPDSDNRIRLAIAVLESVNPSPEPDPVIYLHGGPGGRSLESLDFLTLEFAPFTENRDVIFFDQRGVGFSGALDCPEYTDMGYDILPDDLSTEALMTMSNDVFLACHDRYVAEGVDLSAYTSTDSAADLHDIVRAMGYEWVNLLGISYGTRLGLTVMRDYPEMLRSVILDAVLPPQVNPNSSIVHNTNRVFNVLFDACAADAACREKYPNLEIVFYDTVEQLNEAPELVSTLDIFTDQQRDVLMNGDALIYGLFDIFYQTEDIPNIPEYIYQARDGDYDRFLFDLFYNLWDGPSFDETLYMAIHCNEEVPFDRTTVVSDEGLPQALVDLYGPDFQSTLALCAAWGEPAVNTVDNEAVESDVPTLVMVGEYDPITPPSWAALAAETLSNSYFYTLPATGHATFSSSACASAMMLEFVADPAQAPDASCIRYLPPPLFAVAEVTSVDNRAYRSDTLDFSSIVPDGWFEIEAGVFTPNPGLRNPTPLLAYRFPESLDQYISTIITNPEGFYHYDTLPEPVDELAANGRNWQIYMIERETAYASFAMSDDGGTAYVIGLIAPDEATRELLYEGLLVPALEVFAPAER